jgi:hypothetical protein
MLLPIQSQFEPHDRLQRPITSSPLRHSWGSVAMRIRTSRSRDRTWLVVLASCVGVYLVLAVGFHWLLQPIVVKNSEATASKPPPAMFAAFPAWRRAEPNTSREFLRSVPQRSAARVPAPAGEPAKAETSEPAEQAVEARPPKPRKVAAPRLGANGGPFPAYSGDRPF